LTINAKFLTAGPTGVHRVAEQLIRELAKHQDELDELFDEPPRLLAPKRPWITELNAFDYEQHGLFQGQLWEQIDLPRMARADLLLNLCNLGPVLSRSAVTMIHDAQVYITPESYSPGFVFWYTKILPAIGNRHARVLTISNFTANELVRRGIVTADRVRVIPNGADHFLTIRPDPGILDRLGLDNRRFVLGLANVQPHKNVGLLIKAFADGSMAHLKLVLVGDALPQEFAALGFPTPDNVIFAGRVSDGEMRSLFENALCLGFPSTTEGFGLPPLEAMTLGCPALVAPSGALPEVCGDAAVFLNAFDPAEWIGAITSLQDHPDMFARYAAAGRRQAQLFTWSRSGRALVDTIAEVIGPRPRRVK
jgi:glycosyltransferase involved in cell wall biosynthesis